MSRTSKQARRARKAGDRPFTNTEYVKVPSWAQGMMYLDSATKPNRIVPRPEYQFPPKDSLAKHLFVVRTSLGKDPK